MAKNKDCGESLNHIANCEECIAQILLHREEILRLPKEKVDEITVLTLAGQK